MLGGVLSGALIGLYFHDDRWMGGYASYRRRLTRLGHISFWGLGFLNMAFAFTLTRVPLAALFLPVASAGFLTGAATMPVCCFLAAWRKPLRFLFPIPVAGVSIGIIALLIGWNW